MENGNGTHSVIAGLLLATVSAATPETWLSMGEKIVYAAAIGAVGGLMHRILSDVYTALKKWLRK